MPQTDANGSRDADFLEPKGWMAWIRLQFLNAHGRNVMEHASAGKIKGRTDQGPDEKLAAVDTRMISARAHVVRWLDSGFVMQSGRSEERRVGKECRYRCCP